MNKLGQGKVSDGEIEQFAIAPRSNAALILADTFYLSVLVIFNLTDQSIIFSGINLLF